jgi:hypothetical protein
LPPRRNLNQFLELIGGQRSGDELQVDRLGHHDIQTLDFVGIQQGFGKELVARSPCDLKRQAGVFGVIFDDLPH